MLLTNKLVLGSVVYKDTSFLKLLAPSLHWIMPKVNDQFLAL